ncbi:UDP-N-acetylmuramate--L-alanine ligase [Chloroflexota bacterium]
MKHIHLIGIGGSGMSAIARFLLEKGLVVSGSDRVSSPFLDDLRKLNARVSIGHAPANIEGADLVIRSSAIPEDNSEIIAAKKIGIPVVNRAEFLGTLMEGKTGIGIAGTHGKTTTSAMLTWVLCELKQDPSYILGGTIKNLGVNAHAGEGSTFVMEADEYDRMFLGLNPTIEVITNVEHDHPDCYPTEKDFVEAFQNFIDLLDENGHLVICGNDDNAIDFAYRARKKDITVLVYGFPGKRIQNLDTYAEDFVENSLGGFNYTATINNNSFKVILQVPGLHNVMNSLAVLTVVDILNLPLDKAVEALAEFQGTGRRFEVCGEPKGITLIDDYAHHPTEIRATLAAARSRYSNRRLWVVWQPHTYSRTQLMKSEFSRSFHDADHILVSEVYAAREPKNEFSASEVVSMMDHPEVNFIAEISDIAEILINKLLPGDVLLVLSAGDADQINKMIMDHLKN